MILVDTETISLFDGKTCSKCSSWKQFSDYSRNCRSPDGLSCECKGCGKAYRDTCRDRLRAYNVEYRAKNRDRTLEYARNHYAANIIREHERQQRRRIEKPDECRASSQRWAARNPEKLSEKKRAYNQSSRGREKMRAAVNCWRKNHPAETAIYRGNRRARKLACLGSYTAAEWDAVCKQAGNRCLWCGEVRQLTPDHVVPLSRGGDNDISNIQPLCRNCNSRKGPKVMDFRHKSNPRVEVTISSAA